MIGIPDSLENFWNTWITEIVWNSWNTCKRTHTYARKHTQLRANARACVQTHVHRRKCTQINAHARKLTHTPQSRCTCAHLHANLRKCTRIQTQAHKWVIQAHMRTHAHAKSLKKGKKINYKRTFRYINLFTFVQLN